MLPLTRKSLPQTTRRMNLLLSCVVAAAVAVPTVYVTRAPKALAQRPPQPSTPAASPPPRARSLRKRPALPEAPNDSAQPAKPEGRSGASGRQGRLKLRCLRGYRQRA